MLLVNQIKLKPGYSEEMLLNKVAATLKVLKEDIKSIRIERRSIDARKKPEIFYVFSVVVDVEHEESILLRRKNDPDIIKYVPEEYSFKPSGKNELKNRPVIVGAGPAGLFAAYYLAKDGYKPIVLERGYDVDTRTSDVNAFWNGGPLQRNSNVLFGEGGAGTFSDGKLNTLVKDKYGRNKEVLKLFIKYGADPEILYDAKPHVGTDVLKEIVRNIREAVKEMGGEFRYNAQMTDIYLNPETNRLEGISVNSLTDLQCEALVLACGHSARDTFEMLYKKGVLMEQKDFAVGLRVEHKQSLIDTEMYSDDKEVRKLLPPATYKLTYKSQSGRGVYSFCMCPGGYVVNASSEEGLLCVNGMSYSARDGENANSAIIVSVTGKDYEGEGPLAGIEFQRKLERAAYEVGNGSVPVERYGDFKAEVLEGINAYEGLDEFSDMQPMIKGSYTIGKVSSILPKEINEAFVEGMEYFGKIIKGFNSSDVYLSGVESRTSSPVRIKRGENLESLNTGGIFPCGEGAGYAGGITSAAMDGIKAYEAIASIYRPFEQN